MVCRRVGGGRIFGLGRGRGTGEGVSMGDYEGGRGLTRSLWYLVMEMVSGAAGWEVLVGKGGLDKTILEGGQNIPWFGDLGGGQLEEVHKLHRSDQHDISGAGKRLALGPCLTVTSHSLSTMLVFVTVVILTVSVGR